VPQQVEIAAREVGPADRSREQRIADEQLAFNSAGATDRQANAAWTMPGRVERVNRVLTESERHALLIK